MSNCENCVWWEKLKITKSISNYSDLAKDHPFLRKRGLCKAVETGYYGDLEESEKAAAFVYGYDWFGLITKPDFGCNQWKGKEDAAKQE